MERLYTFIGKPPKYQIPRGTLVRLVKCGRGRKCIVELPDGTQHITVVSLLRRVR